MLGRRVGRTVRHGRTRLRRIARGALAVLIAWVLAAFVLDRCGGETPGAQVSEWDAIVVLGCRVRPDGTASVALAQRVRTAAELWAAGVAPTIVVTGGVGEHGVAEAEVAATLARELGVPAEAIVLETSSTSTEENATFAAAATNASRVVVVTDSYHAWRAQRVFARHFTTVRTVGTHSTELWPRMRGALREVAAILVYAARGRL
jgi:uncharacterized SAM-binding protein YcdF (DUF218 family)